MIYKYQTVTDVVQNILDGADVSSEVVKLTTDERRHLRHLMHTIESNIVDLEYDELFGDDNGNN